MLRAVTKENMKQIEDSQSKLGDVAAAVHVGIDPEPEI
jgi:hypothetical protein